jgi:DedD protein
MRTVFEEEDEAAPLEHDHAPDRELTISSTTLLAIFFGLVLICGLFFGLGYTLGRRSPADASVLPAAASAGDIQPAATTSKPSAASQPPITAAPADPQAADAATTGVDSLSEPAKSPEAVTTSPAQSPAQNPVQTSTPVVKPALPLLTQAAATPSPSANATTSAAAASAGIPAGIMVQIAAISNPADADVLVSALQKRGYSVTARRATTDSLIHVQVGPFPTRADAIAMRQKLLSDGYNAILK